MINQKGFFCHLQDLLHSHAYWCGVNEQASSITHGVCSNYRCEKLGLAGESLTQ